MNETGRSADDERIIAQLGAIAREIDPPPPMTYELGYQVYELHGVDDELAELVADSWLESHAVRGLAPDIRLLTFQSPATAIEIEISREGTTRSILGQLTHPAAQAAGGRATLQTRSGPASATTIDGEGRFEFPTAPDSLARIRLEATGLPPVTTAWTQL